MCPQGYSHISLHFSVSARSAPPLGRVVSALRFVPTLWMQVISTISEWRRRMRSRRELAGLSYRELKDVGYPGAAEAEKYKPFWQP
jgi:uncharacterized protein YjiS (DUF1127 family)